MRALILALALAACDPTPGFEDEDGDGHASEVGCDDTDPRAGLPGTFYVDQDGDSFGAGAPFDDYDTGVAYLFYSQADGGSVDLGDADAVLGGDTGGGATGRFAAGIGDANADGLGDILVGAPDSGVTGEGWTYLVYSSGQ